MPLELIKRIFFLYVFIVIKIEIMKSAKERQILIKIAVYIQYGITKTCPKKVENNRKVYIYIYIIVIIEIVKKKKRMNNIQINTTNMSANNIKPESIET